MDAIASKLFQYGDIVYQDPYLTNTLTDTHCKASRKIGEFIKLLCTHYPEQVTRKQVLEHLDQHRLWATDTNTGAIVHFARAAFKVIGCERAIVTIYSGGYRLLVPVMIKQITSPLIIPDADIPLLKELLNTHPQAAVARRLVEKLGILE